jgi:hypothetical protein
MPRPRRRSRTVALQVAELAVAVPQVVAHRLTRLALAGAAPNERDRREFHQMSQEKVHAFWQSWFAMGWAVLRMQQQGWIALLQGARMPLIDLHQVLGQGLAPVHRAATANARRLARTPMR